MINIIQFVNKEVFSGKKIYFKYVFSSKEIFKVSIDTYGEY